LFVSKSRLTPTSPSPSSIHRHLLRFCRHYATATSHSRLSAILSPSSGPGPRRRLQCRRGTHPWQSGWTGTWKRG
jgi:hypothetical protein